MDHSWHVPPAYRGRSAAYAAAAALAALAFAFPPAALAQQDTTVVEEESLDLGGMDGGGGQNLEALTGEDETPLQVTGFGIGKYTYDGRTNENTFAGSKLAVALFRELSDQVWFFGQLTTLLQEPEASAEGDAGAEGGEGVATEIEIDNLIVNFTPPGATNVNFSFGKFDSPMGFERDDEPLNLQPTESFNFELARPPKMIGLIGRWNPTPNVDVAGWVANGWEGDIDQNSGKTLGLRLGARPTENTSFGLAGLWGPEGVDDPGTVADESPNRYLLTFDYAIQPTADFVIAGEANYGGDRAVMPDGSDARWYGGLLTLFQRLSQNFGMTLRGEVFRDEDGARTGVPQTLQSVTLAPTYFVGTGREGIFANIEHTTLRIPRFQFRSGIRYNHSSTEFFDTSIGAGDWNIEYVAELVATF
ncbi:MAG: outer membrane beta-barrel protein [Gemmatimonadales bacterium]|jgi:hypothetical protein